MAPLVRSRAVVGAPGVLALAPTRYYIFAVVGMALFAHTVTDKCTRDSTLGIEGVADCPAAYDRCSLATAAAAAGAGNATRIAACTGFWHLNNFDNVARSYVTLFHLTVVNNWHITMAGLVATNLLPACGFRRQTACAWLRLACRA